MQQNRLPYAVPVIPYQDPKLPHKLYTALFENLLRHNHI